MCFRFWRVLFFAFKQPLDTICVFCKRVFDVKCSEVVVPGNGAISNIFNTGNQNILQACGSSEIFRLERKQGIMTLTNAEYLYMNAVTDVVKGHNVIFQISGNFGPLKIGRSMLVCRTVHIFLMSGHLLLA